MIKKKNCQSLGGFNQNRVTSLAPGIFVLLYFQFCIGVRSDIGKFTLVLWPKSKSWCSFEQKLKLPERRWKWMSQTERERVAAQIYSCIYLKTRIPSSQGHSYAVTIDSECRTFQRTCSEHLAAVSGRRTGPDRTGFL